MTSVLVLLSTYNGGKFLREQLDSLLSQTGVDVTILVRDDGSKDETPDVLKEYALAYPSKFTLYLEENIGCRGSFFRLMQLAVEKFHDYDYYAFSDQDDIWLDDKISSGVKSLMKSVNPIKLYFCIPQLVDEHLKPYGNHPRRFYLTLGESFILQPAIGCSMLFSKPLLQAASKIAPSLTDIHDAWTYRLCAALGGDIICDTTAHILYRQHSNNTIGNAQSFKKRWTRRFNAFIKANRFRSGQAKLILDTYRGQIPRQKKSLLTLIASYHTSLSIKMNLLFNKEIRSKSRLHNVLFKIAVIFNRI